VEPLMREDGSIDYSKYTLIELDERSLASARSDRRSGYAAHARMNADTGQQLPDRLGVLEHMRIKPLEQAPIGGNR
jgi:hypothetical protein